MNLVIDIGNTRTKCSVVERGEIIYTDVLDVLTKESIEELMRQFPAIQQAIACSVKKEEEHIDILQHLASRVKYFINFNHRTPVPLRNLYGTPETLGYDRMAAAVGAWHLFPKHDLMVIDSGTAITIDFVSKAGEYLGGNISPGIMARFKALNLFTGKLPMGHITTNVPPIGKNTMEAVEAGVLNGIVAEIESYIMQNPNHKIIFTGGDAIFFAEKLKNPIFVIPNLVTLGLDRILLFNNSNKVR